MAICLLILKTITLDEYVKALEKGIILKEGVLEMTTELSRWQGVCNGYKTIYNNALKMYGGGGTAEKDFWFLLLVRNSNPWD